MHKASEIVFIVSLLLFLNGCATIYNPATGRQESYFISAQQEASIGRNAALEVARKYRLSLEPVYMNRVIKLGRRAAEASDRKDVPYRFGVVVDDEINAFSLPGGYVYVNTGVLSRATDDELAGVLAHEIGHIAARHHVKRIQLEIGYNIVASLAFSRMRGDDMKRAINATFNLIELGYSREDELFADTLAIRYLGRAGFDPNAMVTFLEKLANAQGTSPQILVYLRSHPYPKERIEHAKAEIASPSLRSGSQ